MKGKSTSSHHREQNTYRFQTFAERLAVVNVDVARRVQKLSATPEDADTFFGEAMRKWSELNYTQHFVDFRQEVSGTVFSFTQLIHHQKTIVTALLKHLQVPDSLAYQPLLDLLVQVARDLQSDFYVYFEDVLPVLVSLLQNHHHDTDILEQTFTCLSYLFKFLWRAMVNNMSHVYRLVSPLLSNAYRQYINNFAAESFAFLMRKVKDFSALCDLMFTDLQDHPDQVEGVGRLLFESVKGVQKRLHTAAEKVLPVIFEKLGSRDLPQTEVVACLTAMLNSVCVFTERDHVQPVWTPLLAELRTVHSQKHGESWSEHLGRLLKLLLTLVSYKKGILVLPVNDLTDVLTVLLTGPALSSPAGDLLLQTVSQLLVAERVSLTFKQQGALTQGVYNTTYSIDQLAQFTRTVFPMPLFEKDVLPPLLSYCARCLSPEKGRGQRRGRGEEESGRVQAAVTQLLAELVLHKAPPPAHGEMLEDYSTYLLDFGRVTNKCPDSKAVPENLMTRLEMLMGEVTAENLPTIWAIVLCIPHIRPLDANTCSPVLQRLMESATSLAQDADEHTKDAALCVVAEAIFALIQKQTTEDFFATITPDIILNLLQSFAGNVHALRTAALYFTHAGTSSDVGHVTSEDLFKKLLPFLENNLSSPHARVRLLTLQICVQFDLPLPVLPPDEADFERVGLFRICLEAEKVAVTVQTYRNKLVHLQKLDFTTVPIQLPVGPYDTLALRYLLSQLYVNFTLLWPPVIDLIRSHAVGLKPAVFWDIYETQLKAVTDLTESAGFHLDASRKHPVASSDPVTVCEVFASHRAALTSPGRPDHFNFRKLLWTAMQHFPEVCQPKARSIVGLLFRFLENEFYPANTSIAPTEDLTPRVPTSAQSDPTEETGEDEEEDEEEEEEEEPKNKKQRKRKQRPYNSILVTHLGVFAKFKNPKSLYQEARLRELYYELLPHRSPAVQKVAFQCIMTYKNKALIPYKENLERLMDDKTFKNEIVLFSIDKEANVLHDDHRAEVLPVLIAILHGKMQTKTGKDTGGRSQAHARRSIVFRFLAGCQQQEIKVFFDLVFKPLSHYITDDVTGMVNEAIENTDASKVVPLKKQQSLLTTVDVILQKLGSLLDSYLPSLLHILLGLLAQVSVLLKDRAQVSGRSVTILKALRRTGIARLNQFMATYITYPFSRPEVDAVFKVVVWPQVDLLPTEGLYSPSGLLTLFLTWSQHTRYFDLFRKQRPDLHLAPSILPILVSLLKVKAASPKVIEVTMELVHNLLTQHDESDVTAGDDVTEVRDDVMEVEEEKLDVGPVVEFDEKHKDLPHGVRILMPHVPAVLDYIHGVVDALLSQKGRSKTLPHRVLNVLARLSEFVTDTEQCGRMVSLLFPFLSRNLNRSVDVEMSILKAIQHMVRLTPQPATYVRTMARLFSSLEARPSRAALCDTLMSIGECDPAIKPLADIVTNLNAWDARYVEEPDYLVRLDACRESQTLIEGLTGDDYITHLLVVLHNCVFYINTAVDMSLRDSASLCVQELMKALTKRPNNEKIVNQVVKGGLLPEVRAGLKLQAEVARHEYVLLLSHLIKFFPDIPVFQDLAALADPDIEADFFANLVHIQLHRRGRAMRRVVRVLGQRAVSTETLTGYLLPLVTAYLRDEAYLKQAVILDAAVETVGGIAQCLPWSQYLSLLRLYLNLLPQSLTNQKLMVRVIIAILDGFHFNLKNSEETASTALKAPGVAKDEEKKEADDGKKAPTETNIDANSTSDSRKEDPTEDGEEEVAWSAGDARAEHAVSMLGAVTMCSPALATRIHRTLIKVVIPQLHHSLTRKVKSDDEHKKAKTGTFAEDEEVLRVPIALALVKLMQGLPHKTLDFNLPGLLFKLCHFLRSRAIDIRTTSRDTLVKIMKSLGPSYFSYVLKELRFTLKRGYQLHVLCYTVHTLLKSLETTLTCGDLESSVSSLVDVFNQEIFGPIAEEKNVIGITSKLMEAKSTKSFDSYAILAKFVAKGSLGLVINPLRGILSSTVSHKTAAKVEDVLRKLVPGLLVNTSLETNDLMIFTFGLTSDVMPLITPSKKKKKKQEAAPAVAADPRLPPTNTFTVQPLPSRTAPKAKTQLNTNMHILVEFGLQILYSLLKHSTLNHKELEHAKLLDPFIPTLTKGLTAKYAKVTSVSLRCMVWVFKFPLPSLKAHIKRISDGLFVLLKNYAAAGAASTGDNLELIDTCFKAVTVLVRDVEYYTIKTEELKVLLTYAEQDIHDHTRQATAFSLLKAILSRKLVVPEMHDVMKKIEELSITAHDAQVRQNCRQVAIKFLLNYPLGARLEQHLEFYVSQLEYEHDTGRESALEMLATVFEAFPTKLLHEYSGFFFVPLASQMVNDDSARCRKQAGLAMKQLLSKLDTETRDELFTMITQWFNDDKMAINKLACLSCGILVEVETTKFERRLDEVLPIVDRLIAPDQLSFAESAEERQADHLLYSALTLTSKLVRLCNLNRRRQWARPLTTIWGHVERLLLYPHVWVRLASAELFGLLLAAWMPQELAKLAGKPAVTDPLYLQDNTMDKLHDLCGVFCRQLSSTQLDPVLSNQILKNLVFLGKVLRYLPKGEGEVREDSSKRRIKGKAGAKANETVPASDPGMVEETETGETGEKRASLQWLLSRLCREARDENANTPKEVLKRTSVFKWMAAMALELGAGELPSYLPRMLPLLVRELTDKSPNSDEDLRKLTQEVLDLLKVTAGVATFTTAYAEVLKTLVDKRQTRKRDRATELISDPELSAKRKLKKNLAKQKAKKRKIEDIRPVKRTKKHKFVDIPNS